jgi:class 3 adenylate cyclase
LHLPGYYAGHVRIYLREDPEVAKFAEQIGHKANPELSPDSVEMMFVKLDIVKFTEIPVELQPRAIAELHFIVSDSFKDDLSFRAGLAGENPAGWHPSGVLHTGDGFILPFRIPDEESLHRSPKPRAYARDIAQALDAANSQRYPIRFRISVTCGKVYVTGDLSGKRNYVGEAITESERLLSYIPKTMDDVVVFSDTVYRKFYSAFKNGEFQFFRFGTITDKHKVGHRLYLLDYLD